MLWEPQEENSFLHIQTFDLQHQDTQWGQDINSVGT